MVSPLSRVLSRLSSCLLTLALPLGAQCGLEWQQGEPLPQVRGPVHSTAVFDIDGAGPQPSMLVACGSFDAGHFANTRLVAWDGTQWVGFPVVPPGDFRVLALWNGKLVVAGDVIWIYDGSSWTLSATVGGGYVQAVTTLNGELVVAGSFTSVGSTPAAHVAVLSTPGWVALGGGVPGTVNAAVIWNGLLHVGGNFGSGSSAPNLQAWNGSAWITVATCNGPIESMALRLSQAITNTYLFVGGSFTLVNGTLSAPLIARFSPATATWSAMPGLNTASGASSCGRLFVRSTGMTTFELTAGAAGPTNELCWRWTGSGWNSLGIVPTGASPTVPPSTISYYGGRYYVGVAASMQATPSGLYKLDATWGSVRRYGIEGTLTAVGAWGDEAVVSGSLNAISGLGPLNNIARGRPGDWHLLGIGLAGGSATAFATLPNGDLIVAGTFTSAGGAPADRIARWDGSNWFPLGAGLDAAASDVTVLANGDVVAVGSFMHAGGVPANRVARWDGSAWHALGTGVDNDLATVVVMPNGDIVVGGSLAAAGGVPASRVARWNGSTWSALGTGLNGPVVSLAVAPDGTLWAVGNYRYAGTTPVTRLTRWDGAVWASAPPPPNALNWSSGLTDLVALPDGSIVVGGGLQTDVGSGVTSAAWRLRNGVWSSLQVDDQVKSLALGRNGSVYAAGTFLGVGAVGSHEFAELRPTCPATVTTYGSGCSGSGGLGQLTATSLPWDATVFRSHATGLPANGVAVVVFGFTSISLPMAALLPEGLPGCDLLASLEITALGVPTVGAFDTEVFLAPTPSLIGVTLYHQIGAAEVSGAQVVAISTTNGLALTVGSF